MGVDPEVFILHEMPRQVEIAYALCGHRVQELMRVIAVIDAVYDDIVDVEHEVAVCLFKYRQKELAFRHRRIDRGVVTDIFERHTLFENVLHSAHALSNILDGLLRERDRHQVVELPIITAVTQVFRVHADIVHCHEFLDVPDQLFIQWGGRPNR